MSESDSFIHEVSEEVRRDRLFATLRRYGWLIGALLVLLIGGIAANEWRKSRLRAEAEAAGDALRGALIEADPAARAAALENLATERPSLAALAEMIRADSLAEAGETESAGESLAALAADGETPELYRALASLKRVMLLGATMEAAERRASIETLAAEGAPFRLLALEQRALLNLETGEPQDAIADLETILAAPAAPEPLQARARQLVIAAGGALPLEGTAAAQPMDG